jgi:site-specific DNA recombinase
MLQGKENLRAAIYARVSSEQQAEARTISSQIAALTERVEADGLVLEGECRFIDEGYSGATLVRPGLERLRDMAATGALDRVYVHSPDRLARKYAYQVLLLDELKRCGVELIFLNHNLGRSPEEDLLLQVQGMVAEYERAKILERSRRGKLHAARRGVVNILSGAPYGYRYLTCQEGAGEARYEIVFEEARIVRQIYEWVGRDRMSIGEVRRRLQSQGVASPRGKNYWDRASVWGVLRNPAYKGTAAFGKTRIGERNFRLRPLRGQAEQPRRAYSVHDVPRAEWLYIPVPPLVEEKMYDAVQEQLEENRKRSRASARGARHLLQGLLACKCCGYAYYGKPISRATARGHTREYAYYRCTGTDAYRFGGVRVCDNRQVRTDLLEAAVWNDVQALLQDPQRVAEEYRRRLKNRKSDAGKEQLASVTNNVKRSIARLVDAYGDGLLEKNEFEPRILRARDRLAKLEGEMKAQAEYETQQQDLQLIIGRLQEFAEKVKAGLQECDWSTRREIIRALVKRIEIDKEDVRVVYRISPCPFVEGPGRGQRPVLQDCCRGKHRALRRALFGDVLYSIIVNPLL